MNSSSWSADSCEDQGVVRLYQRSNSCCSARACVVYVLETAHPWDRWCDNGLLAADV
jgi:hypothetical protein